MTLKIKGDNDKILMNDCQDISKGVATIPLTVRGFHADTASKTHNKLKN